MLDYFNPRGYNKPDHLIMLACQWTHQFFLWNIISYDRYVQIQNWFYSKIRG